MVRSPTSTPTLPTTATHMGLTLGPPTHLPSHTQTMRQMTSLTAHTTVASTPWATVVPLLMAAMALITALWWVQTTTPRLSAWECLTMLGTHLVCLQLRHSRRPLHSPVAHTATPTQPTPDTTESHMGQDISPVLPLQPQLRRSKGLRQ